MIITTTETIGERKIRGYCGLVYGTDIYMVGGWVGGGLISQEGLYGDALKRATQRMQSRAEDMGANAIIGVSTNLSSPGNVNYMIMTVTGTAVIVSEPTEDEWFASDVNLPKIDSPISNDGRFSRKMLDARFRVAEDSPVKILNGAIVYDKHFKTDYVQLSFLNCSGVNIEALVFRVKLFDKTGLIINDDEYEINGEYLADEEYHNIVLSPDTKGAVYAEIEYINHYVEGSLLAEEDVFGFVTCPKCNAKQRSSRICKNCDAPLYIKKQIPEENDEKKAIDIRIPILVELDDEGHVVCPNCGKKQTKKSNCYVCMQKFLFRAEKNNTADDIETYTQQEGKETDKKSILVSVDSEGWINCPKCHTSQKASAACKRCGALFRSLEFDLGEPPAPEEEAVQETDPEKIVVRPDENGCITCPHCGKYQSKKSKCFVCKKPINLEV